MKLNHFRPKKSPERVAKAKELRDKGYSWIAIGRLLGVAPVTAQSWLDPATAERERIKRGYGQQPHKAKTTALTRAQSLEKPKPLGPVDRAPDIIDLHRRGYGKQAIAAQLRVPYRAVEEALR